jgi:hypothetical protein
MRNIYPHTYNGKLRIFTADGQKLAVDEVIDRWHEGKHEYVTLLTDDERIYFLRRGEGNRWEVKEFIHIKT